MTFFGKRIGTGNNQHGSLCFKGKAYDRLPALYFGTGFHGIVKKVTNEAAEVIIRKVESFESAGGYKFYSHPLLNGSSVFMKEKQVKGVGAGAGGKPVILIQGFQFLYIFFRLFVFAALIFLHPTK